MLYVSVSRVRITLEVKGKGVCELELVRHLAPLTVGSILRVLPIESRVYRFNEKFLYFDTPLLIGVEKQRDSFKRGEVGFMVSNNTICIFLKDVHGMRFNPIGRVISNMELLDHVSNDVVVLA
jgi:hypothetical protein